MLPVSCTIGSPVWREALAGGNRFSCEAAAPGTFARIPDSARLAAFNTKEMESLARAMDALSAARGMTALWERARRLLLDPQTGPALCSIPPGFESPVCHEYTFFLLVLLGCVPEMHNLYRRNAWPETLFRAGLLDFRVWMTFTRENYGVFGVSAWPWIHAAILGRVVRIGRLQCNTDALLPSHFRVFRHRATGECRILLTREMAFNSAGLFEFDTASASFRSTPPEEDKRTATGYSPDRTGLVPFQRITLNKLEWDEFMHAGDPVINLHIPEDGPLDIARCRESFAGMKKFFRDRLHCEARGFTCLSWLLDPGFRAVLPPDSNLMRFQNLGGIIPEPGKPETMWRVFGVRAEKEGINSVPHRTSLQRALANYLRRGGVFRNGRLFFPA